MKNFLLAFALLLGLSANAGQIIRLTVTVTNAPTVTGQTLTVNGVTRTFSNATASAYFLTNGSIGGSASNLWSQVTAYPYTGPRLNLERSGTNAIVLIAPLNGALSASASSGWASLVLSTNTTIDPEMVMVPFTSYSVQSDATNHASYLVQGISDKSTSAVAMTATAMTNFVGRTNQQTLGQKFITNSTFLSPITTNLVNYGEALHSPGTNFANSFQAGFGAQATNNLSSAVGVLAKAYGLTSTANGNAATASGEGSLAEGVGATASGYGASAVGAGSIASGYQSSAWGTLATATHTNSSAAGFGSTTTEPDQFMIGTSTVRAWAHKLVVDTSALITNGSIWGGAVTNISAAIVSATVTNLYANSANISALSFTNSATGTNLTINGLNATNSVFRGTNIVSGDLSFARLHNTSLANGAPNAAIVTGTNALLKISGPTANYSVDGFAGGREGRILFVEKNDSYTLTIEHDSGGDPTAGNRIYTGTGADVTLTNNPGTFILVYSTSLSRWVLFSKSN